MLQDAGRVNLREHERPKADVARIEVGSLRLPVVCRLLLQRQKRGGVGVFHRAPILGGGDM